MNSTHSPTTRGRHWTRRQSVRWLALGVAVACGVVFCRVVDVPAMAREAAGANFGWLMAATLANFVLLPLMTWQWLALMPRDHAVRGETLWECVAISTAAMNTFPLGGGHALAVGVLTARRVTSVGGAITLLALEQLFEGLSRIALLGVALRVAPLPAALVRGAEWLVAAMAVALVIAWVFARRAGPAGGGAPWRMTAQRYLGVLRRPGAFTFALLMSLGIRAFGVAGVWAVQRSINSPDTLRDAIVVYTTTLFGTGVTVSPGNAGTFELVAIATYRFLGKTGSVPATVAVLAHLAFLAPILLTGWGVALWRMVRPVDVTGRVSETGG